MVSKNTEDKTGHRTPAAVTKKAQLVKDTDIATGTGGLTPTPEQYPNDLRAVSDTSMTSTAPLIHDLGGPESKLATDLVGRKLSGQWILSPVEAKDGFSYRKMKRFSVSGLAEHVETPPASGDRASKKKRPQAPKPRLQSRERVRRDSPTSPQTLRRRSLRTRSQSFERDALAISSAANLAWKETWKIPPPTSVAQGRALADLKASDSKRDDAYSSTESAAKPAEPSSVLPVQKLPAATMTSGRTSKVGKVQTTSERTKMKITHVHPLQVPKDEKSSVSSPGKRKEEVSALSTKGGERRGSIIPETEKQKSDELSAEEDVLITKGKPTETSGTVVLPRSRMILPPLSKSVVPSGLCPAVCDGHASVDKYCPWYPHAIFDSWMPQRVAFPEWLSSEEQKKISQAMAKEKLVSAAHPEPKYVDAATSCCDFEHFASKITTLKWKQIAGKKLLRPEVRRWLLGYPQNMRFIRETTDLMRHPPPDMSTQRDENNERHIFIDLKGPEESLYKDGVFRLEVFFPGTYPKEPLKLRFMTKIYHPNIDKLGRIRMPEVEEKWHASLLLREVLECLKNLLSRPNLSDPIAIDVARRWHWQAESAEKTARLWTRKYAHRHSAAAWLDCHCECCCEQLAAVDLFI